MTLSITPDANRNAELLNTQTGFNGVSIHGSSYLVVTGMTFFARADTIEDAIVICQTCRHGGHASHILDWFFGEGNRAHGVCPIADCDCRCGDEF